MDRRRSTEPRRRPPGDGQGAHREACLGGGEGQCDHDTSTNEHARNTQNMRACAGAHARTRTNAQIECWHGRVPVKHLSLEAARACAMQEHVLSGMFNVLAILWDYKGGLRNSL